MDVTVPKGLTGLESSLEVVNVPLHKCCDWQGFMYAKEGWHYFSALLREYKKNPDLHYSISILKEYYDKYQPRSTFECFLCEEEFNSKHHTTPWVPLPWDQSFRVKLLDNQHFGPNSNAFIKKEFERITTLYHKLRVQGYQPLNHRDGYVRGHFLRNGEDYRFKVTGGQHRMAVLGVLGQTDLDVKLQPDWKRVIDIRHIDQWEQVKNGTYSVRAAQKVFHCYFQTTGKEKAEKYRILKKGDAGR